MSWPELRMAPSSPVQRQAEQEAGDVLVVGLGPAEHGHEPVVEGGRVAAPAVHGQLGPQGDPGVGVAPQVAGQGPLDEAGVGALAVDEEELAPSAGGPEPLAFDVGGLARAGGADDQPGAVLHQAGDDDQAALVGPAEIAVDLDAEGDRAEVVVAHGRGPAHGRLHPPLRLALGAAHLGRVDGLAAASQVERRRQEAERDGQGELGPQERARHGQVDDGGADLAQPAHIAREVVGQGRSRAALDRDHRGDGGQGGEGELPPPDLGHPEECLAGGPGQQRDRAEQEQADGHSHAELAGGGWTAGGQAVAELVVVQRPTGMAPAPGGPMPAPPGVLGMPAAPAPRVLGVPAHAASPPACM
jgi:hypothetical protein